MTKYVNPSHVIAERGVLKFNEYCNRHTPYIIFREVVKHDFGIDGEIEIVRNNEDNKTVATGEILKVQIKSTESDVSYIRNETNNSFNFYGKKEDIEYWKKYKLSVLLVIYDGKTDILYCKKVNEQDLLLTERRHHSIIFSKTENKLDFNKNDFVERFSKDFKERVNFDTQETISTNLLEFASIPKEIYVYDSRFPTKAEIYEKIDRDVVPYFSLNSQKIYSFENLKVFHREFYDVIISNERFAFYTLSQIQENKDLRNRYTEVLNLYIKKLLSDKRLKFSKDYKRFYFRKPNERESFFVSYRTKKQKRKLDKEVVKYYEYGKDKFFRHWALEAKPVYLSKRLYLQVNPKYYFTIDGRETLSPEKITTYTNYLTARERNNNVLNQIHFYLDYLSDGSNVIDIWNFNKVQIKLKAEPINFQVSFGIPLDIKSRERSKPGPPFPFQRKLMLDDED